MDNETLAGFRLAGSIRGMLDYFRPEDADTLTNYPYLIERLRIVLAEFDAEVAKEA